jgi:hypothetical protein
VTVPFGNIPLSLTGTPVVGAVLRLQTLSGQAHCDPTSAPGGGPAARYEHSFPDAQTVWTLNHNLGFRPGVRAYSNGGREMLGEVVHTSLNQTLVYFDDAAAGFAVCT